jgi:hypothetical protein
MNYIHFVQYLRKYSDKPWDWDEIHENPNITMDIIQEHSEQPWNLNEIHDNLRLMHSN